MLELTGNDDWEAACCDMLVDGLTDMFGKFMPWYMEKDAEKKVKRHKLAQFLK